MPSAMPRCWARSSNRSQTPCFAQRSNGCAAGHHGPNSAGMLVPFRPILVPPENRRDGPPQLLRRLAARPHRLDQRLPNRPRQLWAASAGLFLYSLLFLMACWGRSGARRGGWGREAAGASGPWRQQSILGRGRWDADALHDIVCGYVVAHRADEDAVPVIDEAGFLEQGKASCGVARQHTGSGPLAAGLDPVGARLPSAGSACTRPMFRGTVMALSSGPCICPRPGPRIRCVGLRCTYRRRLPLRPSRTLHVPWSSGPSRRGCRSPGWPAAGDNIHGVSEVERALRRAGKGYVPGVSAISQFNS